MRVYQSQLVVLITWNGISGPVWLLMVILCFALTVPLMCINRSHISSWKVNQINVKSSLKWKDNCLARPSGPGPIRHQGCIKISALSSERTQSWSQECSYLPQTNGDNFPWHGFGPCKTAPSQKMPRGCTSVPGITSNKQCVCFILPWKLRGFTSKAASCSSPLASVPGTLRGVFNCVILCNPKVHSPLGLWN